MTLSKGDHAIWRHHCLCYCTRVPQPQHGRLARNAHGLLVCSRPPAGDQAAHHVSPGSQDRRPELSRDLLCPPKSTHGQRWFVNSA